SRSGEPPVTATRLGGSQRASASGRRAAAARKSLSSVGRGVGEERTAFEGGPRFTLSTSWPRRLMPPGFGQIAVKRRRLGVGNGAPIGHPLSGHVEDRNGVEAGNEHAILGADRGNEILAPRRAQ